MIRDKSPGPSCMAVFLLFFLFTSSSYLMGVTSPSMDMLNHFISLALAQEGMAFFPFFVAILILSKISYHPSCLSLGDSCL